MKKKELNSFKNLKSLELEEWSTAYPVLGGGGGLSHQLCSQPHLNTSRAGELIFQKTALVRFRQHCCQKAFPSILWKSVPAFLPPLPILPSGSAVPPPPGSKAGKKYLPCPLLRLLFSGNVWSGCNRQVQTCSVASLEHTVRTGQDVGKNIPSCFFFNFLLKHITQNCTSLVAQWLKIPLPIQERWV